MEWSGTTPSMLTTKSIAELTSAGRIFTEVTGSTVGLVVELMLSSVRTFNGLPIDLSTTVTGVRLLCTVIRTIGPEGVRAPLILAMWAFPYLIATVVVALEVLFGLMLTALRHVLPLLT